MVKSFVLTAAVAVALSAGAASAASLNFIGTGQTSTIDDSVGKNNISVGGSPIAPDGTVIDIITGDQKTAFNGLELVGGAARITYTYLGSEAFNSNFAAQIGATNFTNGPGGSSIGDSVSVVQNVVGLLDFVFGTTAPSGSVGEIMNNGGATASGGGNLNDFSIGYIMLSSTSFYALFDDIAQGDRDFDDLALRIDIAPVPLPAGGLLLITGLAGMAAMRRRKKA